MVAQSRDVCRGNKQQWNEGRRPSQLDHKHVDMKKNISTGGKTGRVKKKSAKLRENEENKSGDNVWRRT